MGQDFEGALDGEKQSSPSEKDPGSSCNECSPTPMIRTPKAYLASDLLDATAAFRTRAGSCIVMLFLVRCRKAAQCLQVVHPDGLQVRCVCATKMQGPKNVRVTPLPPLASSTECLEDSF